MKKMLLVFAIALIAIPAYADHSASSVHRQKAMRMKADIDNKRRQMAKLVHEISALEVEHAKASAAASNHEANSRTRSFDEDVKSRRAQRSK